VFEQVEIGQLAYNNGFENEPLLNGENITLTSSRYPVKLVVSKNDNGFFVVTDSESVNAELQRHFLSNSLPLSVSGMALLADVISQAARFAFSLPNNALEAYQAELNKIVIETPTQTEALATVKRRIGQQKYREAMLQYWGGRCAVTGVSVVQVLRASHAKPWAECETDAERLDVYNGFLLAAHLDALFDQFLISFDASGQIVISNQLCADDCAKIGIHPNLKLRWLAENHLTYLQYHQHKFQDLDDQF